MEPVRPGFDHFKSDFCATVLTLETDEVAFLFKTKGFFAERPVICFGDNGASFTLHLVGELEEACDTNVGVLAGTVGSSADADDTVCFLAVLFFKTDELVPLVDKTGCKLDDPGMA